MLLWCDSSLAYGGTQHEGSALQGYAAGAVSVQLTNTAIYEQQFAGQTTARIEQAARLRLTAKQAHQDRRATGAFSNGPYAVRDNCLSPSLHRAIIVLYRAASRHR